MRLQQIRRILETVNSISDISGNSDILVAVNNSEMSDSDLKAGLDAMSDNAFDSLVSSATKEYARVNRVKHSFSSLGELDAFEASHNCGDRWFEGEMTCVYAYPGAK